MVHKQHRLPSQKHIVTITLQALSAATLWKLWLHVSEQNIQMEVCFLEPCCMVGGKTYLVLCFDPLPELLSLLRSLFWRELLLGLCLHTTGMHAVRGLGKP